ncbi:hypothetical protein EDD16DRAFT_22232 [Pisolithus croceorrhizus]|nr:hypothetical protein EDD16DRAFT_22232 [Pisolithus croceorrhizus]KAI6161972.1 hypothetical protein EDD17DRAFT_610785 [Pisolithus thermaeus]
MPLSHVWTLSGQWCSRRTALSFDGQIRALHCSPRVLHPSESYAADDHVVPDYYIRHKLGRKGNSKSQAASTSSSTTPVAQTLSSLQARTVATDATVDSAPAPLHEHPSTLTTRAIKARKEEETPLMEQLFDSVLSDEIAASTRRLKAKIPVEHYDPTHDVIRHPSGFVVPGNGHASASDAARAKEHARDEEEDRALQTTNVAERVKESDLDSVHAACASTRPRMGKVPCEVREPDGTFKHPSGFIPPTPVQEFECVDSAPSTGRDTEVVVRQRVHDSKR